MHGTNPNVWIEAFMLGYCVGYVKYFINKVMELCFLSIS
jgi:hypothetical protein